VVVEPELQGRGTGTALVGQAVRLAAEAGCEWLHVDFVPEHAAFHLDRCGFTRSTAGLVRLTRERTLASSCIRGPGPAR
jgi:GNAT superfamily N-acetyltransferase